MTRRARSWARSLTWSSTLDDGVAARRDRVQERDRPIAVGLLPGLQLLFAAFGRLRDRAGPPAIPGALLWCAPSSIALDLTAGSGDTGAMSTRLGAAPDDEQVRVEVELASDDPLGQLRGLRAATRQLDAWQREAIARARERGASWADIGDALGVTKQAAWSSYNQDVREALSTVRGRSGLDDEDAQQLADEVRTERNRGASAR
jgi:hypothetical protein